MRFVSMRVDLPAPLAVALASTMVMLPFVLVPSLDIFVSGLFFDGRGWMGGALSETFRFIFWRLSGLVLFSAFVFWVASLVRKRSTFGGSARFWGLIVLVYVLGPGLVADGLLKRFWGRARPADVTDFGGTLNFTPPWMPSDQCLFNCSFVSGEVSGSTATAISLLLVLELWRMRVTPFVYSLLALLSLALPLMSALQRMASGRHFLSDVIFAALSVLFAASLLRVLLFGRDSPVE